ncbi:MAG: hypothetical protein QM820_41610 [Minicystis sp.]
MTRSIMLGLLALVSVGALGVVPIACQSGGVGDPCTPEDEYNTQFPGFKVAEENIESRSFQCSTRICLVNHFQGRVSCPYGQAGGVGSGGQYKACNGLDDTTTCGTGGTCVESAALAPDCDCDPNDTTGTKDCKKVCGISGLTCDPKLKICTCEQSATINGVDYYCTVADKSCKSANCTKIFKSYVCHTTGNCQNTDLKDGTNFGKDCCVPGTDTPVTVPVCGQCDKDSKRNADNAVYCSCRCCPKCCDDLPAGSTEACEKDKTLCGTACDPNFNYCTCPTGFTCSEIRKNVGLGDAQLTGSYCILEKTEYSGPQCGSVAGVVGEGCIGSPAAHVGDGGVSTGDGG